jgi:hypothetical protein
MPDWRVLLVAVAALFLLAPPAAVPPESDGFAALVRGVLPSVVNISVKGKGQGANTGETAENVSYAPHIVDIVGSGSIVDPSGIIVTNRHVIENAYEIMVTLQDGTTTNARLLGKGLNFDLALLKIDVGRPLPAIKVGNSDEVHVGDRVLAIGNPLGLQGTVTNGIVSALHRDLSGPYDEFIIPTRRSITAIPAALCSTRAARSSASTIRSSRIRRRAARSGSASLFPRTTCNFFCSKCTGMAARISAGLASASSASRRKWRMHSAYRSTTARSLRRSPRGAPLPAQEFRSATWCRASRTKR